VVPKRVVKSERKSAIKPDKSAKNDPPLRMFLVPCSCGRYLVCPGCGKRHDPKNRLLQMGFHAEGYWKVDEC
jgi:hypothetical protein